MQSAHFEIGTITIARSSIGESGFHRSSANYCRDMSWPADVDVVRLGLGDDALAREMFHLIATVFGEAVGQLSDGYLARLLGRPDFWGLSASVEGELVGGLTAHTLMMTSDESSELFLYDIAVRADFQRRGIGRRLVDELVQQAAEVGIDVVFVAADDDDTDAIDFYRAIDGVESKVRFFDLGAE